MRQIIERGKVLLVDGPACIALHSGTMRVFGAQVKAGEHLVVRRGRRIPLEAVDDSQIEILLGNAASCTIIDEDPIPPSWKDAVNKVLSVDGRVEVAVVGGIDSGKTSFCIYLTNMALSLGRKVALIDGDLGQSDIGPPGTLGLSVVKKPIIDPFNLKPDHLVFIGITSPYKVIEQTINGLVELRNKAVSLGSDFIVINTDGWVEGDEAVSYKCRLIERLEPNFVIALESSEILKPITDSLVNMEAEVLVSESPKNIKKRDRETRKIIREASYKRYLRDAKVRSMPLNWIKVGGNLEIRGKIDQPLKGKIEESIGKKVVYCENLQNFIILVLKEEAKLSDEEKTKLTAVLNKPVKVIREGDEKGLLVALEDSEGNVLGIGIIHCVDFERGILKVYTNVEDTVSSVRVGQIRLDENGNEIEIVPGSP